MIAVVILLGGFTGHDGTLWSPGMFNLADQIKAKFKVTPLTYNWADYLVAEHVVHDRAAKGENVVGIGYSGGVMAFTFMKDPPFELFCAYDPSPSWKLKNPISKSVKRVISYQSKLPLAFGFGGAALEGPQVTTIPSWKPHYFIQFDQDLHDRTLSEIAKV